MGAHTASLPCQLVVSARMHVFARLSLCWFVFAIIHFLFQSFKSWVQMS